MIVEGQRTKPISVPGAQNCDHTGMKGAVGSQRTKGRRRRETEGEGGREKRKAGKNKYDDRTGRSEGELDTAGVNPTGFPSSL